MTREHAGIGDAAPAKLMYCMPKESFRQNGRHEFSGTLQDYSCAPYPPLLLPSLITTSEKKREATSCVKKQKLFCACVYNVRIVQYDWSNNRSHAFFKAWVSNSGPRAKFGPPCNFIWPLRQYQINIRAGLPVV